MGRLPFQRLRTEINKVRRWRRLFKKMFRHFVNHSAQTLTVGHVAHTLSKTPGRLASWSAISSMCSSWAWIRFLGVLPSVFSMAALSFPLAEELGEIVSYVSS
jgi:hypothetical protein